MAGKEGRDRRRRRPAAAPVLWVTAVLLCVWAETARGDFASDQAECADSLVGLSTCLTYVEGSSPSPTPDCCSGLKQVIGKGPKCLCVLIKDRNEPQLGFKIDANRAMSLPTTCNSPVNIAQCIDILKLDPRSKDAEIFKQYGNATKAGASAEKTAPSGGGAASAGKTNDAKSDAVGLGHRRGRRGWIFAEAVVGGVWASCALAVLSLAVVFMSG